MSRVRNADDFLARFRAIRENYAAAFRPRLAEIRREYARGPLAGAPSLVDESLEAHLREYFVNELLAALNWRLNVRPEEGLFNLIPEAPVLDRTGRMRFLDYLGIETVAERPLLLVETKRPSSRAPRLASARGAGLPTAEVIARALSGNGLSGEWQQWLRDLTDYVGAIRQRTGETPRRVVITNGTWTLVFLDPADAFLEDGRRSVAKIAFFEDADDVVARYDEIFSYLEHQKVLGETGELTPGELPFHLAPADVERAVHGLLVQYAGPRRVYGVYPVITVAPLIFLRSRYGAWVRIGSQPRDYELPHDGERLPGHLHEVRKAAEELLRTVNERLGLELRPVSLVEHYGDDESFGGVPGVIEHGSDHFILVTGEETHYLRPEVSVPNCPHHDWARSREAGVAAWDVPVMSRLVTPRAFFKSGELHHCAHRDVATAKAAEVNSGNRARCGARSGRDGAAFCEIWRFEQHLCCRTCAFEGVCTKAEVFRLPCQRPA